MAVLLLASCEKDQDMSKLVVRPLRAPTLATSQKAIPKFLTLITAHPQILVVSDLTNRYLREEKREKERRGVRLSKF